MKKQSNGLVWGSLLLGLGLLTLAKTMGWYHIDWGQLLRFWPVLIILAGLSLLVGRGQTWAGPITAILLAIALPSAMVNKAQRHFDNNNFNWNGGRFNFDDNDNNTDDNDNNDNDSSHKSGVINNGNFSETLPSNITTAELNFEAGAGKFKIDGATAQLFEATTESEFGGYSLLTKRNDATKNAVVNFKMDNNKSDSLNINLNKDNWDNIKNVVKIQLNDRLTWDMKLGIGAGKADFDLSKYKVQNLEINSGVSKIDLKLGDKSDKCDVEINAGVASIDIEIPESVGCEFVSEGALNIEDLDELTKISDGLYRTTNFDRANKKVKIVYKGGLSTIKISRY